MTDTDSAKAQAQAQLESIIEMVEALNKARTDLENEVKGADIAEENAIQAIDENPLCVSVRSDWHSPSDKPEPPEEYMILLCTGGPACRIIGTLSEYFEPETARIEYQDWGTPWTDYPLTSEQEAIVLEYAQQFYYGE